MRGFTFTAATGAQGNCTGEAATTFNGALLATIVVGSAVPPMGAALYMQFPSEEVVSIVRGEAKNAITVY